MLTHIVIFKYRDDVHAEEREEHLHQLRRLSEIIPEVESLSVDFDILKLPRSYDTGLIVMFRDRAALNAYAVNPEHIKVAELGRNLCQHIASVDFET